MTRAFAACITFCVLLFSGLFELSQCQDLPPPPTRTLKLDIWDFSIAGSMKHPDFETFGGSTPSLGLVLDKLGSDGLPVFNPAKGGYDAYNGLQITNITTFQQWFVNNEWNRHFTREITLKYNASLQAYHYVNDSFYPIDDAPRLANANDVPPNNGPHGPVSWGFQGLNHNFGFCAHVLTSFHYYGGETFLFSGDDDVWVFINKQLAVDLGGLHPKNSASIALDESAMQLDISPGNTYQFDLFYCERHSPDSDLEMTTGLKFQQCGDGIIQAPEECDVGNQTDTCCTETCRIATAGEVCRPANGSCDVAEVCPGGNSIECPQDDFAPDQTPCTPDADMCVESAECSAGNCEGKTYLTCSFSATCNSTTGDCECPYSSDTYPQCTSYCGDGIIQYPEEQCDSNDPCCVSCQFASTEVVCRPSAGPCDLPEYCTGFAPGCPDDNFWPPGTSCQGGGSEQCDGWGICGLQSAECTNIEYPTNWCTDPDIYCFSDMYCSNGSCVGGQPIRCGVGAYCNGSLGCECEQPELTFPNCAVCGNGIVEIGEQCDSDSPCCISCQFAMEGTTCRSASGDCDYSEQCTGWNDQCPSDSVMPSGKICRGSNGVCGKLEKCDGVNPQCPSDDNQPSSKLCRRSTGPCDQDEYCTGDSDDCPPDQLYGRSKECRAAQGPCDVPEYCTGKNATCPTDQFQRSSYICRPQQGNCDVAEYCTGTTADCPIDYEYSKFKCNLGIYLGIPIPLAVLAGFTAFVFAKAAARRSMRLQRTVEDQRRPFLP